MPFFRHECLQPWRACAAVLWYITTSPMNKSDLDKHHNGSVLVKRAGKEAFANLDTRLFKDQPCLTFPEDGTWKKVEPYQLTDADIDALVFDAGSGVIRSPLAFDL